MEQGTADEPRAQAHVGSDNVHPSSSRTKYLRVILLCAAILLLGLGLWWGVLRPRATEPRVHEMPVEGTRHTEGGATLTEVPKEWSDLQARNQPLGGPVVSVDLTAKQLTIAAVQTGQNVRLQVTDKSHFYQMSDGSEITFSALQPGGTLNLTYDPSANVVIQGYYDAP